MKNVSINWEEIPMSGAQKYKEQMEYDELERQKVGLEGNDSFYEVSDDGYFEINYHAGQSKVISSDARFIIALAGRQSGKTQVVAPWLYNEMRSRGPGLYMVVAPSFPILFNSALPKIVEFFDKMLGLGKVRNKPFAFIVSKDGEKDLFAGTPFEFIEDKPPTTIRLCHAQDASSLEAMTALACVFDEAGQNSVKIDAFEAIEGRLTTTQGRLLMTTTPYAINSLFSRYYKPWEDCRDRGEKHPSIDVVQFRSTMNPRFPMHEYNRLKGTMPEWKFRMFYNGEFTRPAGQIYGCFDDRVMSVDNCTSNVVKPFKIPPEWPRYTGHDFGGSNTSCVWFAEDPGTGFLYLYRTYLSGEKTAEEHLAYFLDPYKGNGNLSLKSIWSAEDRPDRSMGGNSGEDSFRREYKRAGLYIEEPIYKDKGSVELGIDIVYGLLSSKRLKVFSDQEEIIKEFKDYSREIDPETGDVILGTILDKGKYHLLDATRYGAQLVSRNWVGENAVVGGKLGMDPNYDRKGKTLMQGAAALTSINSPQGFSDEDWDSLPESIKSRAARGATGAMYVPQTARIENDGGISFGNLFMPNLCPPPGPYGF